MLSKVSGKQWKSTRSRKASAKAKRKAKRETKKKAEEKARISRRKEHQTRRTRNAPSARERIVPSP